MLPMIEGEGREEMHKSISNTNRGTWALHGALQLSSFLAGSDPISTLLLFIDHGVWAKVVSESLVGWRVVKTHSFTAKDLGTCLSHEAR